MAAKKINKDLELKETPQSNVFIAVGPEPEFHDFTLNESKFTHAELALNPAKEVFIKNSKVTNDELVKYFIVKYRIMEYKCGSKGCPMKDGVLWRRRPAYLMLNRRNNRINDLSIANLSLTCPNCYLQDKGIEMFETFRKKKECKCFNCGYPVKHGYELCSVCTNKLQKCNEIITKDELAELAYRSSMPATVSVIDTPPVFLTDLDEQLLNLGIIPTSNAFAYAPEKVIGSSMDAGIMDYKKILGLDLETVNKPMAKGGATSSKKKSTVSVDTIPATSKLNVKVTPELKAQLATAKSQMFVP